MNPGEGRHERGGAAVVGVTLLVFVVKKAINWMLESAGESDA